jgi:hypothetical protein
LRRLNFSHLHGDPGRRRSPAILAALFFRQLARWTHELPFDEKRRKDFA